ncbi:MAG: hypothetical protein Fur0041_21800 [Bacteroidia bacterium]
MKKILLAISAFAVLSLSAQDFHYSMFTMAPLTMNPALTGNFTGDLRIINNYRTQWSSVTKPYVTYTFGGDYVLPRKDARKTSPDFFAIGVNVNADKAGSTGLRNNQYNVSGSYNKSLDGSGYTYFSFGFMVGLHQRSLNLSSASWGNQWTGVAYDPSWSTGEALLSFPTMNYGDYSAGLAITSAASERFKFNIGAGFHHLSRPRIDFMGFEDRLYLKTTLHTNALIALGENSNAWLVPAIQFVKHGPAQMINVGTGFRFRLSERSRYTNYKDEKTMTIGMMYRMKDAASGYIRIDWGSVGVAFNYDMNVSSLTPASNGMGAMEFMLIYTGIYRNKNSRMSNSSFF